MRNQSLITQAFFLVIKAEILLIAAFLALIA